MSEVKRWDLVHLSNAAETGLFASPEGAWVRHIDHDRVRVLLERAEREAKIYLYERNALELRMQALVDAHAEATARHNGERSTTLGRLARVREWASHLVHTDGVGQIRDQVFAILKDDEP